MGTHYLASSFLSADFSDKSKKSADKNEEAK